MAINSRSKGCKNERKLAKLFETWTKRKFSRTPSSGGLNWKASNVKGDIVCTEEGVVFPFCIEAKAHKEIDFSHLLNPAIKNVKIDEFWKQCKGDAEKAFKIPILFMRYNGMPADFFFVALETRTFIKLFASLPEGYPMEFIILPKRQLTIIPSPWLFDQNYKEVKLQAKLLNKQTYGQKKKG